MDDLSLRNLVLATLERLPLITASEIGVAVHHGIVILTGIVPDESHKALVECTVLNLPNVRGLAQKIHVSADVDFLDTDEQIAMRLIRMVDWNISKPERDIRVRVEDRWATLNGHVGCREDFEKVEQFASVIRGCCGFTNHLIVTDAKGKATAAFEDEAA
ncbi:BON domain-containing protein [Rhizobium sp. 32-5/1]|uniref:BON domain-containing protein n=1 Tax=Rhizobium sp. 32-5/1 TaxID=3019602 RepID=UPI00240E823F|nr:BON domain-containing protein [Rhizobium sp. 32-5/1]WEZ84908.1 BON domain-containing protein [Rhizobium sp. 32-5/1]